MSSTTHLDGLELADAAVGARLDPLGEAAPLQQLEDHTEQPAAIQYLPGRNSSGVQGLHLNPLLGFFLRTFITSMWIIPSAFPLAC
jgi:hypothetical protein